MIISLHGLSTMHSNIKTDIRIARELDFGGIEIIESKLLRYIENQGELEEIRDLLQTWNIVPTCINALKDVEVQALPQQAAMLKQCETLTRAAQVIGCQTIQVVPFCSLDGGSLEEVLRLTAGNIKRIARVGQPFGVRYQIEPIAFSVIHSLASSLDLIKYVDEPNVGMVIDFWHLWAGNETKPEDVAKLNKDLIYGVHFCDGVKRRPDAPWDEAAQRGYLPDEGDIDIRAWVDAVKATGYDGAWSSELYSPVHWEQDIMEVARITKERMEKYLK